MTDRRDRPRAIFDVAFYRSSNGAEPVRKWLKGLRRAERKMIGEDIKTVQLGWPLGMPLVRSLGRGLWEVRSSLPNGIARVIFTMRDRQMVLLHGFIKKTQKTPDREMKIAQMRAKTV